MFSLDKSIGVCIPCDSTCKTCNGGLATNCLTCESVAKYRTE